MRPSIRSRLVALVRAQWAGLLALFLVIAGGTAYAANTIGSSDIINGQVKSVDIGNNQVQGVDIEDESVAGGDIADQSGVDTCTHGTVRFGEFCVGVADEHHDWLASTNLCAVLGLRLPSIGEAFVLARNFDLPNVDENEDFWTDEHNGSQTVWTVTDAGGFFDPISVNSSHETVCITTPTN